MNPSREGRCHLCGQTAALSFEHVPPRAAFNNEPVYEADVQAFFAQIDTPGIEAGMTENVRGAGGYPLCHRCNNETGSWYGHAFVSFAKQGMPYRKRAGPGQFVSCQFRIRPLLVVKQVLTMFCSAFGPGLASLHPDLRRFLRQRDGQPLPDELGVHAALFSKASTMTRQSGGIVRLDLEGDSDHYSEIAFPPFVFVLTVKSSSPDQRLVDITSFAYAEPGETRDLHLHLCNLIVEGHLPGVYFPLPNEAG